MTKVAAIKNAVNTMHDLEALTSVLEQTSAQTIAQLRKTILDSRPFFREVWRIYGVVKELAPQPPNVVHKQLIVCIGIDWGMPGGLLDRVIRKASELQKANDADMLLAGKMTRARFREQIDTTLHFFPVPKRITLQDIQPIYETVAKYARVTIVYPSFTSLSKQSVVVSSLSVENEVEAQKMGIASEKRGALSVAAEQFIVDPDPQAIADYLNQAIAGFAMHHYFLESILAYNAAQMVAMRNSHDNAKDEAAKLSIQYQRVRREVVDKKLRELHGSRGAHGSSGGGRHG